MPAPRLALLLSAALVALVASACSQVTQTPDECTQEQFYDESTEFCLACPALKLPAGCPATCGFVLNTDSRGCQVAECSCDACPDGAYFDADRVACVDCPLVEPPACQEGCPQIGTAVDALGCLQPACSCEDNACPPVAPPECGDEGCCTLTADTDANGCSFPSCSCPETPPEGFYFDNDGLCRACPDEGAPEACDAP